MDLDAETDKFSPDLQKNNYNYGAESMYFLKNKQYYVTSIKAYTKIESNVTILKTHSSKIKKQFDLCQK